MLQDLGVKKGVGAFTCHSSSFSYYTVVGRGGKVFVGFELRGVVRSWEVLELRGVRTCCRSFRV